MQEVTQRIKKNHTAQITVERGCKTVLIKVTELSASAKYLIGL